MKRYSDVKRASLLGILANLFLLVIKIFAAFLSNSRAMISDAFNSAGDIFSSLITFIGNKISSKPSDDDHNLGHGKAEYIYSMLISIIMIYTSIIVIKNTILSINNNEYVFSKWLIFVCIITIITKFLLFIYTNKISKKHNNLLIKANSLDHRNDTIITSLTLLSAVFSYYNIKYVDIVAGIIIAVWILIQSIEIFINSYDVLMDKCISKEVKDEVYKIIKKYPEIKKIQHFNSTPVGYMYQISLTIFVDGKLSTYDSHDIADRLEKEITNSLDEIYLTVIHVNPI